MDDRHNASLGELRCAGSVTAAPRRPVKAVFLSRINDAERRSALPPAPGPFPCLSICLSVRPSIASRALIFDKCHSRSALLPLLHRSARYRSRGGGGGGTVIQNCELCSEFYERRNMSDRQSILDRHFADGEVLAGQGTGSNGGRRAGKRLWYKSGLLPRFFLCLFTARAS